MTLQEVTIEKMVNGGYGLGKLPSGKTVFVEGAYPGERVLVKLTRIKKDFSFAKTVTVLEPSPKRVIPPCPHFGVCGGCQWMDIDYEEQLAYKKNILEDTLKRIGKIEETVLPVVPSERISRYRGKMEFSLSKDKYLGLKMRYSHKIVKIKRCEISPDIFNDILRNLRKLLDIFEIPIYDFERKKGVLKHVVLRHAVSTNQTMVIFVTKTESFQEGKELAKKLKSAVPGITSIIHVMNSKDSVVLRGPYRTLWGEGIILERFDWEEFQIPPTAFFQNNYWITRKMLDHVYKELNLEGNETVLDLYSGIGTFSIRTAKGARKVIAVESNRISVKAGKSNASINRVKNVNFVEDDVEDFLGSIDRRVDKVILDPPREGAGIEVMKHLLNLKPVRIVYVSCEPSTLARDLKVLVEGGYSIEKIQPFDMFPHTFHVETVVTLSRRERSRC